MTECNDMDQPELSHHLVTQSIRLYFANVGFPDGSDNLAILNRATSRMYELIDLVKDNGVREDMRGQVNYALSGTRSERTFHSNWAQMQMDMFRWGHVNEESPEMQSLQNFYLQPLLNQGTETIRLLYLRFLAKMCVMMGGMSNPDFCAFQGLLDQGATLQEQYPQQGFIFSLVGFMNSVSHPKPSPKMKIAINNLNPEDWNFEPSVNTAEYFFTQLAQVFNPISGVCE